MIMRSLALARFPIFRVNLIKFLKKARCFHKFPVGYIDDDNRFFLGNVFGNSFNTFQLIWLMDSNNEILKLCAEIPDQFITPFCELIRNFLNFLRII